MEAKASNKSGTPKYIYTIQSFQNGRIAESEIFAARGSFLCKLDRKDAYYQKKVENIRYVLLVRKFTRISVPMFWLGSCPQIFTKLLKIPIVILRRIDLRMIIYLDMFLIGHSIAEIRICHKTSIFLLHHMGFVIKRKKSNLMPVQRIELFYIDQNASCFFENKILSFFHYFNLIN